MDVKVTPITDDSIVMNTARVTVWKDKLDREPSEKFMRDIYFTEHSPIRAKEYLVEITGIPSWISVHLVRHHEGFTPFVSTQRDDRHEAPIPRSEAPQGTPVNMDMVINAQAFINISRKRLCGMASPETRAVWQRVVDELRKVDPNLADCCVPNCVYRGGICPEIGHSCKYNKSDAFKEAFAKYMEGRE